MGLFDTWKVSGITTDASKFSEPFHHLAITYDTNELDDIPLESILSCAYMFVRLRKSFDAYFNDGIKSEKIDAIKFLVAIASYIYGKDGIHWNWQKVRNLAQGFYTSMEESPSDFLQYNLPLIKRFSIEVEEFIYNNT
jgi:hypothetical protein